MISIIVPVYNGEKHLQRCLDSIRNQTYADFEVIVVDDGSTDGTGKICDNMARMDPRFHIIHQKNAGVAAARNVALAQSKGDLAFIDADDYVDVDYLEKLRKGLDYPEVDVSYCLGQDEDEEQNIISGRKQKEDVLITSSDYDWNGELQHPIVWGAIFRKEIVTGITFDERFSVAEDSLFFAQCLKNARKLYFVHDTIYHYVQYQESASHGKFDLKNISEIYAWREICELYQKSNAENQIKAALAMRIRKVCRNYYSNLEFQKNGCLKEMMVIYHSIQGAYFRELIKNRKYRELFTGIVFGLWPSIYLKIREEF